MTDYIDNFEDGLNEYAPHTEYGRNTNPNAQTTGYLRGEYVTQDTDTTKDTMTTNTQAPLADGATVHIQTDDPLRVTRDGATYRAWDIDDEGEPVGDPWALSEGAVRGLLGRHDWTRVEATASVRDSTEER